jgi:MoxR-like ATPase
VSDELRHLAPDVETLAQRLASVDYLVDEGLATAMFLSLRLPQPLLLEGEAGVGKTEAGKALAAVLDTPLIRLQCYDGIDAAEALYDGTTRASCSASGWRRRTRSHSARTSCSGRTT